MPIQWREELETGIKKIDDQHQYLVCLINTIEAAATCGLEKKVFLTHLDQLEAYTHFHFEHEEKFQLENNYPHYESNKEAHGKLIKQLAEIFKDLKSDDRSEMRQKQVGVIFDVLREWLVDHIIGEDMKMREFFGS